MDAAEILQELRDIELPEAAVTAQPAGFAYWPFGVLAGFLVLIFIVRRFRAFGWRRAGRARLRRIDALPDPAARWGAMIGLLKAVGRRMAAGAVPEGVFRPPERVTKLDLDKLRAHLGRLLGR